jgi:hypothetical protein
MQITREQFMNMVNKAPQGIQPEEIAQSLMRQGYTLQGFEMPQGAIPQQAQPIGAMQPIGQQQTMGGRPQLNPGSFELPQDNRGFLTKARDFTVGLLGGGKIAEGAGKAIAANQMIPQLSSIQEQNAQLSMSLLETIKQREAEGADTTRLKNAFASLEQSQQITQQAIQDMTDEFPTGKEIAGSATRLATTMASGALWRGAGQITGQAQSVGGAFARGAGQGAISGAVGGALHGGGLAAEEGGNIGTGAVVGTVGGAVLGGLLGGSINALVQRSQMNNAIKQQILTDPNSKTAAYLVNGSGRLTKDKPAQELIKSGFDEGTTALIKGSGATDRQVMREAVSILEKGRLDKKFSITNRPTDAIGDSLNKKVQFLANKNREAAKQLEGVALELKGTPVDARNTFRAFVDDLSEQLGVKMEFGKPSFAGSNIEDIAPAEKLVSKVVARINKIGTKDGQMDAYDMHKLKKFIDEQVNYAKQGEGLGGKTESVIKNLRKLVDGQLDETFPRYDAVNTQFSQTKTGLDNFFNTAGSKLTADTPNIEKQLGTLTRRITSNAQSRTAVLNELTEIQKLANKMGGNFKDDIVTQVAFADELEKIFGSFASTSLGGATERASSAAAQGAVDVLAGGSLVGGAKAVAKSALTKTQAQKQEQALKALKKLLGK